MTLTMPTRELVGLLSDVYPFASKDPDDATWHRVVLRWDGARLHTMAGDGYRFAWMSWGPEDGDDVDQAALFDPSGPDTGDRTWELAIMPENAKEVATKFKLPTKDGDLMLRVDGSTDSLRVQRDTDWGSGGVALTSSAMARPWDESSPAVDQVIGQVADTAKATPPRQAVAYLGGFIADFVDGKKVRQRGPVVLHFGLESTYLEIGRWFRGAVVQDDSARPSRV